MREFAVGPLTADQADPDDLCLARRDRENRRYGDHVARAIVFVGTVLGLRPASRVDLHRHVRLAGIEDPDDARFVNAIEIDAQR